MPRRFRDTWDQVATPGDAAAVLLGGSVGWAFDIVASIHGAPSPGTVGAITGSATLGVKKAIEAQRAGRKPLSRANKALDFLKRKGFTAKVDLQEEIALYKAGVNDAAELNRAVTKALKEYTG